MEQNLLLSSHMSGGRDLAAQYPGTDQIIIPTLLNLKTANSVKPVCNAKTKQTQNS